MPLALAERIADAALRIAGERGVAKLAVVVTDAGGAIRVALRADGTAAFPLDIAHAKAQSALGFGRSTLLLSGHFGEHVASTIGVVGATGGTFVPIGGGVVAVDAEGRAIGAVGVAGGLPASDDAIARAALQDQGLQALA